eukprot:CAMPEP_0181126494 /NCGR_PEP_ID=MMETSP1071-20121207/27665_1 /TAXON_ID=35127 /ORGANISM="Thalassiosira sp., Strain NH16" /LENGTH=177 /DNA_ID=CAMNT_0023212111 /DNA_START=241 /DNA_END=771 /DNA_ORIENTATION=+
MTGVRYYAVVVVVLLAICGVGVDCLPVAVNNNNIHNNPNSIIRGGPTIMLRQPNNGSPMWSCRSAGRSSRPRRRPQQQRGLNMMSDPAREDEIRRKITELKQDGRLKRQKTPPPQSQSSTDNTDEKSSSSLGETPLEKMRRETARLKSRNNAADEYADKLGSKLGGRRGRQVGRMLG